MITGCSLATPTLVYAWLTKEEFDRLAVPETVHDWMPCRTTTVINNDGQQWERRCHSKTVEDSGAMVIFQWFDERPMEAGNADVASLPFSKAQEGGAA